VWNTLEFAWGEGFKHLTSYKEQFGDCLVERDLKYCGYNLGSWVHNQRRLKNRMTLERAMLLDQLGFVWDLLEYSWEEGFKYLAAYKKEFGDCSVPYSFKSHDYDLGNWLGTQRRKKGQLTSERLNRLNELGIVWDPLSAQWEEGFLHLVAYKKEFGDCSVPYSFKSDDYNLGSWLGTQRRKKGQLTSERLNRLNELGIVWDPLSAQWEEGFLHLVAYKKEFGDCLVLIKMQYHGFNLGQWVSTQRKEKDKLTHMRLFILNELGFVWKVK
jgi:hypothetical protein